MLDLGPDDQIIVCQNCNTCVTTGRSIVKEHYLLPAHYSASEALERLILWIKKQAGVDEELPVNVQVVNTVLSFFPFWNLQVRAATSYNGIGEDANYWDLDGWSGDEYKHIQKVWKNESSSFDKIFSFTYPAAVEVPQQLLSYEFPTRAKKYFGESYARESGGRVLNGRLSQQDAESKARSDALAAMTSLIMREVAKITRREDKVEISSSYYLHVPVWDVTYQHGGKNYRAFIDASTGRVIQATFPVSLEYRIETGGIGAGHLVLAVLLGLIGVGLFVRELLPLAVGLGSAGVAFLAAAVRTGRAQEATR